MKIIDIARNIDKSEDNTDEVDIMFIGNKFGLDLYWQEQQKLKSYWVSRWLCTDSWVGTKIYFLGNEPVAFSSQSARKSEEYIKWFSDEVTTKVKAYLMTLVEEDVYNLALIDINSDVGDNYKIYYNTQIIDRDKAMLNGKKIEIIERIKNKTNNIDTALKIKEENGLESIVDVKDLDFEFYLEEN